MPPHSLQMTFAQFWHWYTRRSLPGCETTVLNEAGKPQSSQDGGGLTICLGGAATTMRVLKCNPNSDEWGRITFERPLPHGAFGCQTFGNGMLNTELTRPSAVRRANAATLVCKRLS
jgi:hypothetical protein